MSRAPFHILLVGGGRPDRRSKHSGLSLRKEVSHNVSRASLHIFLVTVALLVTSMLGAGLPDGP